MSKVRCDFAVLKLKDNVLYIRDLNHGNMSVTNDAENVLEYLQESFGEGKRVIYQDSDGRWDEMRFDGNGDAEFVAVDQEQVERIVNSYV